ncbi:hypothetical protein E4T56_gene12788 [Termitomyces sp. T112]|nr:hypothetical protein E4T56_gene12788 [Termitomyces sp. T112]
MNLISQSLQALLECLSPNSTPPMAEELAPPAMAPALVPPCAYSPSTSPRFSCPRCLSPTPGDSHGCGHGPTTLHGPAVMLEMQEAWALCMTLSPGPGGPLPFHSRALLQISMSSATGLLTPTRRSMPPPSAREYLQAGAAPQHSPPIATTPACTLKNTPQCPPTPPTFLPPTITHTQPLQST